MENRASGRETNPKTGSQGMAAKKGRRNRKQTARARAESTLGKDKENLQRRTYGLLGSEKFAKLVREGKTYTGGQIFSPTRAEEVAGVS